MRHCCEHGPLFFLSPWVKAHDSHYLHFLTQGSMILVSIQKASVWEKNQRGCIVEFSNKVRKTQHQNPEFGPRPGEIHKRNLQKSTLAFQGVKLRSAPILVPKWVSSGFDPLFPFFLSASTAATYIFTALTCTTRLELPITDHYLRSSSSVLHFEWFKMLGECYLKL